MKKMINLNQKT